MMLRGLLPRDGALGAICQNEANFADGCFHQMACQKRRALDAPMRPPAPPQCGDAVARRAPDLGPNAALVSRPFIRVCDVDHQPEDDRRPCRPSDSGPTLPPMPKWDGVKPLPDHVVAPLQG